MDFDNFENMDQVLQVYYEKAISRKAELEAELRKIDEKIEQLTPIFGNVSKKYTMDMLKATEPVRRSAAKAEKGKRGAKKEAKAAKCVKKADGEGRRRVKEDEVRSACIRFLEQAAPESRSGTEIMDYLVDFEGYMRSNSLRSRIYTLLGKWAEQPGIPVVRIGRGVYGLKRD